MRKHNYLQYWIVAALAGAIALVSGCTQPAPTAAEPAKSSASGATPGFNQKIPEKIMTPDAVESRLGTLKFVDGVPTVETTKALYDNLDFMRGVEVFLDFVPATSMEALRLGNVERGASKSNQAVIMDQLLDSNPLFLTGNTDTVYCMGFLDLDADGPTVIEVPPGSGPGTVDDAFFRFVTDLGGPGPDRGQGGKYLIIPDWFKGAVPKDKKDGGEYYISRSPSTVNWVVLRGFLQDGKPDAASKMFRDGVKIYSLSKAAKPPKMEFINGSKAAYNTVHANNFEFYHELDAVIQREPLEFIDPELRGLAGSIGIIKGRPFSPDDRMKKILTDAVGVGNATARAFTFRNRDPRALIYDKSQWSTFFIADDYQWLGGDGMAGRNLDARTYFFYVATVNTPAMAAKIPGKGSQYAGVFADSDGNDLTGAKSYRLHVPANVPANDFWSVVAYDPQTRSELQTPQPYPSKNNKRDKLIANADGSVDLYFSPAAPRGKEDNWIATIPGKAWFPVFRLYGPTEPWFNKTWRPGELEIVR